MVRCEIKACTLVTRVWLKPEKSRTLHHSSVTSQTTTHPHADAANNTSSRQASRLPKLRIEEPFAAARAVSSASRNNLPGKSKVISRALSAFTVLLWRTSAQSLGLVIETGQALVHLPNYTITPQPMYDCATNQKLAGPG